MDEIWLSTRPSLGMKVVVGFNDPTIDDYQYQNTWMGVTQQDGTVRNYEVTRLENDIYELYQFDVETDERNAVNNIGGLGTARLLSILADAHINSPLEELNDDDYIP